MCGESFTLSGRNVRAARARGEQPVCRPCRIPVKELSVEERQRLVDWWITESGLSLVELREIAFGLWPNLAGRPDLRLVETEMV